MSVNKNIEKIFVCRKYKLDTKKKALKDWEIALIALGSGLFFLFCIAFPIAWFYTGWVEAK